MPVAGPFYFAWATSSETTFGSTHLRMDEYIFSAKRTLSEGQKPAIEIEMENPYRGLLSTDKVWAWFAMDTGTGIVPLMFGRVLASPVDLSQEVITVQLVTDPLDYKQRVQRAAEPLKVLPYWDPVFIDVSKRDDPDTILEARASFWEIDPVSMAVTAVGIVDGPDGNIDVTNHIYESFGISIGDPPATAILMDATVSWTQSARGVVDVGTLTIPTITADAIIGEWPKPYASLGAGYFVRASDAFDSLDAANATTRSWSWSWQNKEKTHEDGDTMSASASATEVAIGSVAGTTTTSMTYQPGFIDPGATDGNGNPSPLNIPMSYNESSTVLIASQVETSLLLEYVAERPRTERVVFMVRADTQPLFTDHLVSRDSETITLNGADVGVPIVNLLNWSSVANQHVDAGTIIFPDNPVLPGGQVVQRAVNSGTTGTVEPTFSDVSGDITVDNGVNWASLGQATPTDNVQDWKGLTYITAGTTILPKQPHWVDFSVLVATSTRTHRPASISEGEYVRNGDGTFSVCTVSGEIGEGVSVPATMVNIGSYLPSGTVYWLALNTGSTGPNYVIPAFGAHETVDSQVTDNGVTWQCVAIGEIPAGGSPGQVHAAGYFHTDRGKQSLVHLALRVRSRLLYRGRCIEITFQVGYVDGIPFTTRKTVTIHDSRIPGGVAVGKIKSAVLEVSDGTAVCSVTIACTVGRDNAVAAVAGDPDYVDDDYVEDEYQTRTGELVLLPNGSDLAYAPPIYTSTDDGITFPLVLGDILITKSIHGTKEAQIVAAVALAKAQQQAVIDNQNAMIEGIGTGVITQNQQALIASQFPMPPVWVEYVFKPLNAGPFHKIYTVKFSDFTMGRGIDLESTT